MSTTETAPTRGSDIRRVNIAHACDYVVVIPAYKAVATIGRAIESALAQTLPPSLIVIVDDGSPDGEELAALVSGFQGPIRLLRQPNAGPAAARNRAIAAAQTTWIAFLDADDSWLPDKLERQLGMAGDARLGLIYGSARESNDKMPASVDFDSLWQCNRIGTSMTVVRRAAFEEAGGFDEERALVGAEDYNLWLRIAANGWQMRACPGKLGNYTPATNSITSQLERCANGEIHNARKLGAALGLGEDRVEKKILSIHADYGRHLLNSRDLRAARRMLAVPLRKKPTPELFAMWAATFVPSPLLQLRSRLRLHFRRQ